MSNSYYTSPTDIAAVTKARSADINDVDASVDAAFDKLPTEDNLKRGTVNFAVDTGAVNAYVIALPHVPSGYVDGLLISFRPLNTNAGTSGSTVNVNGLGVKSLRRGDSAVVSAGDITVGSPVTARYSTATGYFHLSGNSSVDVAAAAASALAASASASAASSSASSASGSASSASTSASTATTQASAASSSASAASTSASTATTQASNSSSSASSASTSASTATTQAGLATTNGAAQVALATTQAGNAATSASSASTSATTATTQASTATSAASTATTQASSATTSATTATTQAGIATTKAAEAAASAASIAAGPVVSVNGMTGAVTGIAIGSGTADGTNTGDNATNTQYSGLVSNATHTGDATGGTSLTVVKINGTLLAGLTTGLLKNTTATGVPSIATPGSDYQAPLVSGTNIKTINGASLLGSGDLAIVSFPSGTVMLFVQTAAPTGWTKSTTHNNKALRIVSGTVGTGGTSAFTTAFASRTPSGTVSGSVSTTTSTTTTPSGGSVTIGATTLTTAEIPSHDHSLTTSGAYFNTQSGSGAGPTGSYGGSTGSSGGGGSHTHTGSISGLSLSSSSSSSSTLSASFSGAALDFAVQYVDAIIATKD
jgi:hypothetical protein